MSKAKHFHFLSLISEIGKQFYADGEVSTPIIQQWKGKEISNFQNSLLDKTGGRISEKWFYTHIKNEQEKLPRIDILNLLSQYIDYKDWYDFQNSFQIAPEVTAKNSTPEQKPEELKTQRGFNPSILIIPLLILLPLLLWFAFNSQGNEVKFCFFDMDRKSPIEHPIEIEVLSEKQSSSFHKTDNEGCINFSCSTDILKFVVRSPYHKADTVVRVLEYFEGEESIPLKSNDFALMLHYFSVSDVENWKRRRVQLDQMIHEDAIIYQLFEGSQISLDMLNKEEFIDKLTLPVNSLKNIDIISSEYQDGQIINLRFIQK